MRAVQNGEAAAGARTVADAMDDILSQQHAGQSYSRADRQKRKAGKDSGKLNTREEREKLAVSMTQFPVLRSNQAENKTTATNHKGWISNPFFQRFLEHKDLECKMNLECPPRRLNFISTNEHLPA